MKKLTLLTLICILFAVALNAAQTRAYTQALQGPGSAAANQMFANFPDVTNTATQPSAADYVLSAYVTARPADVISTATHPYQAIRVFRFGNGSAAALYTTCAYLQFSAFGPDWAQGEIVHFTLTKTSTGLSTSWDLTIPDNAGTAIGYRQPINPIPVVNCTSIFESDHWTYNLQVNGPDGIAVTGPGTYAGTFDQLFTCGPNTTDVNDLIGTWTAGAAPAGMQWVVNPIIVQASDFVAAKVDHVANATKVFELVPIPDTYTLHVTAVGPATMILKGGISTGQIAPWDFTGAAAADLIGVYSMDPAGLPAGYHWEPASIEVVAGDFVAAKSAVQVWGTMSNGAKVAYAHGINFTQTADPIVVVPADPATFPAYPAGTVVGYVATGVSIQNLFIARNAGETGALAYIGGAWLAPDGAPDWTWLNVNFDAKAPVFVIVYAPTLPVELSNYTGMMTAEYFVQLNWTSQSETSLLGYRVLRGESSDMNSAISITPTLIGATNTSSTQNYTITDTEVENNTTYSYWLESVNMDGTSEFHGPVNVRVEHEVPPVLPEVTSMRNAYPNPMFKNGNTTISVSLKAGETGTVTIYNILGQVVKTYNVNEGTIDLNWNGKDSKGNTCGSGIYFYRLSTPSMNQTKKMVIMK